MMALIECVRLEAIYVNTVQSVLKSLFYDPTIGCWKVMESAKPMGQK
jgi:hypothetical protein